MRPGENRGEARVAAVCVGERKGKRKRPVPGVTLMENHGVVGDAHAGEWRRQVSLLMPGDVVGRILPGLEGESPS